MLGEGGYIWRMLRESQEVPNNEILKSTGDKVAHRVLGTSRRGTKYEQNYGMFGVIESNM